MMHLGHQPRSEIMRWTLEELAIEHLELMSWIGVYQGADD